MSISAEGDAFFAGTMLGGVLILGVWAVSSFFTQPADIDNGFRQGYCLAMGGEIISGDICAKDGQIIPIPSRP